MGINIISKAHRDEYKPKEEDEVAGYTKLDKLKVNIGLHVRGAISALSGYTRYITYALYTCYITYTLYYLHIISLTRYCKAGQTKIIGDWKWFQNLPIKLNSTRKYLVY